MPWCVGRFYVVGVIKDVTDFGLAFWVRGWEVRECGGGGGGDGGWGIGIEDDLVIGAYPACGCELLAS